MSHRDAQVTIIVGKNGTGKSTFAQKAIKGMKRRAVIVTFDGMPKIWRPYPLIDPKDPEAWTWKKGIKQIRFDIYDDDTFKYIFRYARDMIVVFDDCKEYIRNNVDNQIYLKRLLSQFRHRMLDIFFIAHAPDDVPKRIWIYYSTAFIGATDVLFDSRRLRVGSVDKLITAQQKVNAAFRAAKMKNNGSHYGLFEIVQP